MQGDDCVAPCIFGIIPGKTTYSEARVIFYWLRLPITADIEMGYKEKETTIFVRFTLDNGIIKNIVMDITLPGYKIVSDPRNWQAYSPETLMKKYGNPTNVGFKLNFPTEGGFEKGGAWYDMVFDYEPQNMVIEYNQGLTQDGKFIKACPLSDQYSNVRIFLGKDLSGLYPPVLGVPLEQATTLTMDQFSALLQQKTQPACFEISQEAVFSMK